MSIDLSANPLFVTGAVFIGGVATSLTPCLYPMIPITVSIVGAGDRSVSRWHRVGVGSAAAGADRFARRVRHGSAGAVRKAARRRCDTDVSA